MREVKSKIQTTRLWYQISITSASLEESVVQFILNSVISLVKEYIILAHITQLHQYNVRIICSVVVRQSIVQLSSNYKFYIG